MCSEFHFRAFWLLCGEWLLWRKEWKKDDQLGGFMAVQAREVVLGWLVGCSKAGIVYIEKLGVLDKILEFEPRGGGDELV